MTGYRRTHVFFVALLMLLPVLAYPQGANGAMQQVRQAEKERFDAMVKGDVATLDRLLADDLTYTHGNARLVTKAEFIGELKSGVFKYVSITPDPNDLKVRVSGTIAVVNGTAAMRVVDNGKAQDIKIRYTNVQAERGGRWQMIAWQASRLP